MRKNKKLIALLSAVLLAALSLAAVPVVSVLQKPTQITLVMKTDVSVAEFWEIAEEGVKQAAADHGVELKITGVSAETQIEEQIAVMDQVIAERPDVIVLASTDYNRLVESAEAAVEAGIKLVTLDSDVNTDVQSCYIGSDNYEIGCAMGRLLTEKLPGGGKVAILAHGNSSSGIDRVRGAQDVLKQAGDYELVGTYDCDNDSLRAQHYTQELLAQHGDLAAIICSNEVCNIGAADYIAANAAERGIVLIGCDSSKTQVRYLEQDIIQGIVIQQPFNMGYMALKSAAQLADGMQLPRQIEIPCVTVTKDNMYDIENQKLLFPFETTD